MSAFFIQALNRRPAAADTTGTMFLNLAVMLIPVVLVLALVGAGLAHARHSRETRAAVAGGTRRDFFGDRVVAEQIASRRAARAASTARAPVERVSAA